MPSSEINTARTEMIRIRFIRMMAVSSGIQNARNAAYSAGSGHADCQNASPRYSFSSQLLHGTAVNQRMVERMAARQRQISEVEIRQTGWSLYSSARAFRMTESREQTAIMTAVIENRNAVWLTESCEAAYHRSAQKVRIRMGSRKKLLLTSSRVHSSEKPAHTAVVTANVRAKVLRGERSCSRKGARQRNAAG